MEALLLGDAMIPKDNFEKAWFTHLNKYGKPLSENWEDNWDKLQYRRLEVEKHGPEIENISDSFTKDASQASFLLGLFAPVSSKLMDSMPKLRIVGVCRAGLENVNVEEATKRGILVFNVKGRNAHAVSDFTIGMILNEMRNISRAHHAIKTGEWRKKFTNSDMVPELSNKKIGLIGFGHIGKLVAKKLSGFEVKVIVYDPYTTADEIQQAGCTKVELNELLKDSDIISLHARLSKDNYHMIAEKELKLMKPTAYLINTARANLVDESALAYALENKLIAGAAIDVFSTEPISSNNPLLELDNVTLTTHIAGTTTEALTKSPFMLAKDIQNFIEKGKAECIVNNEVLKMPVFREWLHNMRSIKA